MEYRDLLSGEKHIHLIGIGGVSMSSIAKLLIRMGHTVSGSDERSGPATEELVAMGARFFPAHHGENVEGADLVVYTAAVKEDNPELKAAREKGIPVFERGVFLGIIASGYKYPIAISGTHGKTTTTSMVCDILVSARKNPTVHVGGFLPSIGGNLRIGKSGYFVCEACEYCDSFQSLHPWVAVILNIEEEHLDYFKDIEAIIDSFRRFASQTSPKGTIVALAGSANVERAIAGLDRKKIYFGLECSEGVHARALEFERGGYPRFEIYDGGRRIAGVSLQVPGRHNVFNALAAAAAGLAAGAGPAAIERALNAFKGAKRRFELIGKAKGITVVDDYAHHPTEIAATLNTAKSLDFNRVFCVFQPHTYTRTIAHFNGFISALSIADKVILTDIYAAREKDIYGISSKDLAAEIDGAVYIGPFAEIERYIFENAEEGDLVITMGAGDIDRLGRSLVKKGRPSDAP